MIDSHCHLADEVFAPDLDVVVERARAARLERALVILDAGNQSELTQARRLSALWPEVRFSIGIHPHQAHAFADRLPSVMHFLEEQWASTPSPVAIGEIGLDYHYDFSPRDVQQEVFRAQVRLARSGRPVVIHTREADADTIAILREEGRESVRGVLHCFTGTAELARAALDLGFYISLAGIITFPKAGPLRDTVRSTVPLKRLLVETDSPFLAPVPHRGKRNEPAHVAQIIEVLAGLYGLSPDQVEQETTANFHTLFRP